MANEVLSIVADARRVEALGKVYDIAIELIQRKLKGDINVLESDFDAAVRLVGQWAKVRQTDNARAALNFMMSRHLAQDPNDLRTMVVEVMEPGNAVAGALVQRRKNGVTKPSP